MLDQNHKPVNVSQEKWRDWNIVSIQGAFVIRSINEVRNVLNEIEKNPMPHIALDFLRISFVDSSAISVMVNLHNRLHDVNGKLVMFGLNKDTQDVITICGIDKIIQVFQTRAEFEESC